MLPQHVAKNVDALAVLSDRYLARVKIKVQIFFEKRSDGSEERLQLLTTWCYHHHEVIRIADIKLDLERVLDELIELVEVDIRKELRGEVADGDALLSKESRCLRSETLNDLPQEYECLLILQAFPEDAEEDGVIDGREELFNVALEHEAGPRRVSTHTPEHLIQGIDRPVRPLTFATGERMSNERRLEDGIEHGEDGMVQDTILHGRFVDASLLGIADGEGAIRLMPVGSGDQLSVQLKEVLLQIPLEPLHILPSLFPLAEFFPCYEQGFLGDDSLEEMPEYLHCGIVTAVAHVPCH